MEGKWKITHTVIIFCFSNTSEMSHSSYYIAQNEKPKTIILITKDIPKTTKKKRVFHLITTSAQMLESYRLTGNPL